MPYRTRYQQYLWLSSGILLSTQLFASQGGGLRADNSLGNHSTQVTVQNQTLLINGGLQNSGNLLHSFEEFNVETGQTADFQAAANTQNIVGRVTGPNDSWINGKIKSTTSNADLYLVNPNGVVFGENASLDLNGAFHASTADYVTLEDGQQVYADPNQGVTLTVAAPEAFGFLDNNVGDIQINGSQLEVGSGQEMTLVTGEINIQSDAELKAEGGRINLIAVASAGEVQPTTEGMTKTTPNLANINVTDSLITVNNQAVSETVGQIVIQGDQVVANNSKLQANNSSAIDAMGNNVSIKANAIRFSNESRIASVTRGTGQGGSVALQTDHQIDFDDSSIWVRTIGTTQNTGDAGNLTLQARDIRFSDTAQLSAVTRGTGQGGSVKLTATGDVTFQGREGVTPSSIFVRSESQETNAGAVGDIQIQAANIKFSDGAYISADTFSGKGGLITLDAGNIRFSDAGTAISATTYGTGKGGSIILRADHKIDFRVSNIVLKSLGEELNAGDAGNLTLQAHDIRFSDVAQLSALTTGIGRGGIINLAATGTVTFQGNDGGFVSGIFVRTESKEPNAGIGGDVQIQATDILFMDGAAITAATLGSGKGGSIILKANNIRFSDAGTMINATTEGTGKGGSITLQADHEIDFRVSNIVLRSLGTETNAGDAGNLTLQAHNIHFSDVAQLSARTTGTGRGGTVNLIAVDTVTFQGREGNTPSGIFVRTEGKALNAGAGGDIQIQAADILFVDGAAITAATTGSGIGGTVNLQAKNAIQLKGQETMFRGSSENTGAAGSLKLQAAQLHLDDGARIASEAFRSGSAGRIELELGELLIQNGAKLTTETFRSGNASGTDTAGKPLGIFITADKLELQTGAVISSESTSTGAGGAAGLIQIDLTDTMRMSGGSSISTATAGQGDAGNITIGNTAKPVALWMSGGSTIQSGSSSAEAEAGRAGSLKILTGETIDLFGGSAFTTESKNAGGGGIEIKTRDRLRLQDSKITTSVEGGEGQGGNIDIDPVFIILENSQIQANAHGGSGGNITLVADYLFRSGPTTIEASSALSTSGDIDVQAVDVDAGSLQAAAEVDPLDVAQWQAIPCNLRGGKISRLIMAGRDAHPTPVDDLLSSLPIWARMPLGARNQHQPATPKIKPSLTTVFDQAPRSTEHSLAATKGWSGCSYL